MPAQLGLGGLPATCLPRGGTHLCPLPPSEPPSPQASAHSVCKENHGRQETMVHL